MKIITNTAISLDGRISTVHGHHVGLGSAEDHRRMSLLRHWADAILIGGATFRTYPHPLVAGPKHLPPGSVMKKIWNIVVSRSMNLPLTENYFCDDRIRPLFFTVPGKVPPDFKGETVTFDRISPPFIIQELQKREIGNLLIEAGGNLIFQFLQANLVDEMHVTLCPKIIGGKGAPSLVDGEGFLEKDFPQLQLMSIDRMEDELFLRYGVVK